MNVQPKVKLNLNPTLTQGNDSQERAEVLMYIYFSYQGLDKLCITEFGPPWCPFSNTFTFLTCINVDYHLIMHF